MEPDEHVEVRLLIRADLYARLVRLGEDTELGWNVAGAKALRAGCERLEQALAEACDRAISQEEARRKWWNRGATAQPDDS